VTSIAISTSIDLALTEARRRIPIAEARLLLRYVLGCSHAFLEAHAGDVLTAEQENVFQSLVNRRSQGEPIAYLTGKREFYGRDFAVTAAVLIPRPETELLVETGLAKLAAMNSSRTFKVLDLGTGSACVALTLALELARARRQAMVTATDISATALAVAKRNAAAHGAEVCFIESDWFAGLAGQSFDLIVANPPYIAANDSHLVTGDLCFEPQMALASGADGLDAIRRIVAQAPQYLVSGGWLLFEHGYDQGETVAELLHQAGFTDSEQHRDLAGIVRVSGGRVV